MFCLSLPYECPSRVNGLPHTTQTSQNLSGYRHVRDSDESIKEILEASKSLGTQTPCVGSPASPAGLVDQTAPEAKICRCRGPHTVGCLCGFHGSCEKVRVSFGNSQSLIIQRTIREGSEFQKSLCWTRHCAAQQVVPSKICGHAGMRPERNHPEGNQS